jgi:hypothetical protein
MTSKLIGTPPPESAKQDIPATGGHVDLSRLLSAATAQPIQIGLDPMLTKLAVELQTADLHGSDAGLCAALLGMRELLHADTVFVALFDEGRERVSRVLTASSVYAGCNPDVLTGEAIPSCRALCERLDAQRLLEIRNTARNGQGPYGELVTSGGVADQFIIDCRRVDPGTHGRFHWCMRHACARWLGCRSTSVAQTAVCQLCRRL